MNKTPQNTFREILIGLFITVVGGILVAWIIREGELFQSGKQAEIAVSVRNDDCNLNDFFIDGEKILSSIAPETTRALRAPSGEHWIQTCSSDNATNCQDPTKVTWSSAMEYTISKSSACPIEITLTNNDCKISDMYIDGILVVSSLSPSNSTNFQVVPGTYLVKICVAGTDNCTEQNDTFQTAGERSISKGSSCPVDITLTNNDCKINDMYIDGTLVVSSLSPGSSTELQVVPGTHLVKICVAETDNCTEQNGTFQTAGERSISKGSNCP